MFAFLFRLERFSWRLVAVILTITGGVVLMVASETQLMIAGMLLVILASALGGLRWALTQILLNKKEMGMDNPVATIFWLAPSMAITLAVMSMIIEGFRDVFRTKFFDGIVSIMRTLLFILFPGMFAFAMVMTEY
jgi:solute carrier family 35, member C2